MKILLFLKEKKIPKAKTNTRSLSIGKGSLECHIAHSQVSMVLFQPHWISRIETQSPRMYLFPGCLRRLTLSKQNVPPAPPLYVNLNICYQFFQKIFMKNDIIMAITKIIQTYPMTLINNSLVFIFPLSSWSLPWLHGCVIIAMAQDSTLRKAPQLCSWIDTHRWVILHFWVQCWFEVVSFGLKIIP